MVPLGKPYRNSMPLTMHVEEGANNISGQRNALIGMMFNDFWIVDLQIVCT